MKRDMIIEIIYRSMPNPLKISDIDSAGINNVRFTWRGSRFRVSNHLVVEEVERVGESSVLSRSNEALLVQALLQDTVSL